MKIKSCYETQVFKGTIHYSQKLERIQTSTRRYIDKQNLAYAYEIIVLVFKKEGLSRVRER